MFEYSLAHWSAFLLAALLLNLSPGPDMAYILGRTAQNGKRAGLFAMLGVWCGAFMHVMFAVIGLSAILAASATAFTLVKWGGAIYLIWLGCQALKADGSGFNGTTDGEAVSDLNNLLQGIMVSLLNPKVAIFFLAFLPQFVVPGAGPESAQLFLHGVLIIAVAGVVEVPLIFLGSSLMLCLKNRPDVGKWIDRKLGALFISLGLRLAFSER